MQTQARHTSHAPIHPCPQCFLYPAFQAVLYLLPRPALVQTPSPLNALTGLILMRLASMPSISPTICCIGGRQTKRHVGNKPSLLAFMQKIPSTLLRTAANLTMTPLAPSLYGTTSKEPRMHQRTFTSLGISGTFESHGFD